MRNVNLGSFCSLAVLFVGLILTATIGFGAPQSKEVTDRLFSKLIFEATQQRSSSAYDSAYATLQNARSLATSSKQPVLVARAINEIGLLLIYEGKFSEALSNLQTALSIYEDLNHEAGVAECLNNIATVHYSQKDYQLAQLNYKKSLKIRERGTDLKELGISYNNLGIVLLQLGEIDSSYALHQKSLAIWEKLGSLSGKALTLSHIGNCLKQKGDFEGALEVLLYSHQIMIESASDERSLAYMGCEIGLLLNSLARFDEAKKWCIKSYALAKETNSRSNIQKSCECLYTAYQGLGDYKKAFDFYQEHVNMRDSIFGYEMTKEVTRLELSYAFDKVHHADSLRYVSENKLQQQRITQQKIGLVSIGGMLFIAAIMGFFIFKGKRKSDDLLLNILPKETAQELKKNGKSKARLHLSVTVLFTDFKGFTQLSEQLTPQQLVAEINEYFSAFDKIMEKHGVEKIKTIGDSYMAAGGLPVANKTHASDVVKAALEIQQFMANYKAKKLAAGELYFDIRIGVNTGPVVAGIVGIKKFQFDIWGDTVNTASRMESSGEVGKVNISENTYEMVKDQFNCTYRGEIEAKGKGKIKMYFVDESA